MARHLLFPITVQTQISAKMKFLVLALCVCAANAANLYKSYNQAQAAAQAVVTAPVLAAKAVFQPAAQAVFQPAAQAVYQPAAEVTATAGKTALYAGKEATANILRSDSEVTATGFDYLYETENGISAQASGALKTVGDVNVFTSKGSYRYTAPDGTPVEVTYVANENGFQAQGNVLPVGPPIPEAILRSLAYIANQPAFDESKKY